MRKKPCSVCRKWFMPDRRVGARQRACSLPECRQEQRRRTQAGWRAQNPDYFLARRLLKRSAQAEAAASAAKKPHVAGEEPPRRPPPIVLGGILRQLPWDVMQDEIGVQTTDSIAVVAKVIVRAVQSEKRPVVVDNKGDPRRHRGGVAQDEMSPVPG